MGKLAVFNQVSLDGYFADRKGGIDWARGETDDPEWDAYVAGNAGGGGILLFGRVTYQMMERFWPTPAALAAMPAVAERMNARSKIVVSKTLDKAVWNNTRLIKENLPAEIRALKQGTGEDIVILGSGSLVSQLTDARLIDEYQLVVFPVALGKGKTMFDGIRKPINLKLARSMVFGNGRVLLCYEPND
jgi:dihydrofolate reductase